MQLQVNAGTADTPSWVTVNHVTQTVTVGALLDVTGVTATVVDGAGQTVQPGEDDKYTVAMDEMADKTYKLQAAFEPDNATYQTGTWHSSNEAVATVSNGGRGEPGSRYDSIPIANRRGGILVCRGQRHTGK